MTSNNISNLMAYIISTSSLRPRVWRSRDTALAASAGKGQL